MKTKCVFKHFASNYLGLSSQVILTELNAYTHVRVTENFERLMKLSTLIMIYLS